MGQVLIPIFVVALAVGIVAGAIVRKRQRQADSSLALQQHPERLDQMLDPTDDA
jgi:hypothetical protein